MNFEEWYKLVQGGLHPSKQDAIVYTHDTLEIAKKIAIDIFGENVTPSDVMQVYDRLDAQMQKGIEMEDY